MSMEPGDGWCGCCGRSYEDYDGEYMWCGNCAGHILEDVHLWDATYFAQHGKPCPYQLVP